MTQLAITAEFLESLARLPRKLQKKVREFTRKFSDNPKSSAINYEKIHDVADERVRTVRIDQQYRAVVLHPNEGDVHVMLWVDNHDEAMAWASKKQFAIHPETNAFQIFSPTDAEKVIRSLPEAALQSAKEYRLYDSHSDKTLESLGVPGALLPSIRAITTIDDLKAIAPHLPVDAAEALFWLAEGLPVDEIREAISEPAKASEPTLGEALEQADSSRRLVKIKSVDELDRILDAPLEQWRVFLHPTQRRLVEMDCAGPALVTGGAGTGKTVVALHRAKHLATDVFKNASDRILFTTFTANMAEAISRQLDSICGPERSRIEVVHLGQLARQMLGDQEVEIASDAEQMHCWDLVVDDDCPLTALELQKEWQNAFELHSVTTQKAYLRMSRVGMSKPLNRHERTRVWKAFEAYRANLQSRNLREWSSILAEALEKSSAVAGPPYRSVIVDESQDFNALGWRLIRSLAPVAHNDLFLVGDPCQRIYGSAISLQECGIDMSRRVFPLRINYRTTEEIRDWAVTSFVADGLRDMDGAPIATDSIRERSLLSGPLPEVTACKGKQEELNFYRNLIPQLLEVFAPEEIVLCARAKWILRDFRKLFHEMGQHYRVLEQINDESASGLRLATMHRVKGLEFRCVLIASVNEGIVPRKYDGNEGDTAALEQHFSRERALLYVATTRARERVVITTSGKPSSLLLQA